MLRGGLLCDVQQKAFQITVSIKMVFVLGFYRRRRRTGSKADIRLATVRTLSSTPLHSPKPLMAWRKKPYEGTCESKQLSRALLGNESLSFLSFNFYFLRGW